jgi:hypothetical protein
LIGSILSRRVQSSAALETEHRGTLGILKVNGKENTMLGSGIAVQIVAGVLAAAVLGIIVYRRKQKAV